MIFSRLIFNLSLAVCIISALAFGTTDTRGGLSLTDGWRTALKSLPAVDLTMRAGIDARGKDRIVRVSLENPGRNLAFFVRLRITNGRGGEEVLPILWEDNYFPLMPGEKKDFAATFETDDLRGVKPTVELDG